MSRIAATFERLRAQGRKALIPYVTAGFPFADVTPSLMHGMVEAGADVILTGSMGPDLIGRDALATAKEAGVFVISETSGVNASGSKGAFASSVESNLLEQGRLVGERLIKEVPAGSKIGLLFDQQAASGRLLEQGFRKAIGDKFDIVAQKQFDYAKGVPGGAADANAMMQAHPDIAAFWCPYDGPCSGVGNAVLATGKKVKVFSKGGYPAFLDYIRKGVSGYTLAEPNTIKVLMGFDQAVKLTRGANLEKTDIILDLGGMITASNIGSAAEVADGTVSYGPGLDKRFYERWGVK
jgi:ABC-type sugar transport system substrate-binding protein